MDYCLHISRFCNTLYSEGKEGKSHIFKHPFLQTWGISVGEFSCILLKLAWNLIKNRSSYSETENNNQIDYSCFLFLPTAILHQGSRCLIYMSLIFTTASSYQFLSGSTLIFTCIFSKIFLRKALPWYKWFSIVIIVGKKRSLVILQCKLVFLFVSSGCMCGWNC